MKISKLIMIIEDDGQERKAQISLKTLNDIQQYHGDKAVGESLLSIFQSLSEK